MPGMSPFDLGPHESVEFNRHSLRVRKEICRLVVSLFHVVSLKFGGIWSDEERTFCSWVVFVLKVDLPGKSTTILDIFSWAVHV